MIIFVLQIYDIYLYDYTRPPADCRCHSGQEGLKEEGHTLYRSQGEGNNFWIIQDYGHIVVHIFLRQYRDFYRLEDLWADVPRKEYKERRKVSKTQA